MQWSFAPKQIGQNIMVPNLVALKTHFKLLNLLTVLNSGQVTGKSSEKKETKNHQTKQTPQLVSTVILNVCCIFNVQAALNAELHSALTMTWQLLSESELRTYK